MADREKLIQFIDGLYPADCEPYPETAAIGKELLAEALAPDWRDLPEYMLLKYAMAVSAKSNEPLTGRELRDSRA